MLVDALHRPVDDIGGDLSQRSLAAPPSQAKTRVDAKAALGEDLDMVAEAEDDALQRRPPDMGEAVMQAEAEERAAGMGVLQRRLLAEEIGQQHQPLGSRPGTSLASGRARHGC
jgi:hypothetical protein